MKINPSFKIMNNAALGGYFMLCLLLSACGGSDQSKSKASAADTTLAKNRSDSTESVFSGDAEFLDLLFKNSPCNRKKLDSINPTGPITCSLAKDALHTFCESYRVNGAFSYYPTVIANHVKLKSLFESTGQTNYGLVFHYGYISRQVDNVTKGEIVYILSRGQIVSSGTGEGRVSYCPFEKANKKSSEREYYLMLKSNDTTPYDTISKNDFQELKAAYLSEMKVLQGGNNVDIDAINHPQMVYHDPRQLLKFYETYERKEGAHLYIAHGAIQSDGLNRPYHTPCFFFGDATTFYKLDNTADRGVDHIERYVNQGLDIGQLCPPQCNDLVASGMCSVRYEK